MIKRYIPSADAVRSSRLLRWLGPRLHDPDLWRLHRQAVAKGVAIGLFFGLMVPVLQIPVAALVAFIVRANLWVSAASTLVTNPFTFGPIYFAAYSLGTRILGVSHTLPASALEPNATTIAGWIEFFWTKTVALGQPLLLGLLIMAVLASTIGYFATHLVWRIRVVNRRKAGLNARARRGPAAAGEPAGRTGVDQ